MVKSKRKQHLEKFRPSGNNIRLIKKEANDNLQQNLTENVLDSDITAERNMFGTSSSCAMSICEGDNVEEASEILARKRKHEISMISKLSQTIGPPIIDTNIQFLELLTDAALHKRI